MLCNFSNLKMCLISSLMSRTLVNSGFDHRPRRLHTHVVQRSIVHDLLHRWRQWKERVPIRNINCKYISYSCSTVFGTYSVKVVLKLFHGRRGTNKHIYNQNDNNTQTTSAQLHTEKRCQLVYSSLPQPFFLLFWGEGEARGCQCKSLKVRWPIFFLYLGQTS